MWKSKCEPFPPLSHPTQICLELSIATSSQNSSQQGWPWGQATDLKHTVRVCLTRGRTSCMPTFLTSNGLVLVTCKYVRHELADAVRTISHVWHSVVCCSLQVTCNSLCFKRYNTALTTPKHNSSHLMISDMHFIKQRLAWNRITTKFSSMNVWNYECLKLNLRERVSWV